MTTNRHTTDQIKYLGSGRLGGWLRTVPRSLSFYSIIFSPLFHQQIGKLEPSMQAEEQLGEMEERGSDRKRVFCKLLQSGSSINETARSAGVPRNDVGEEQA